MSQSYMIASQRSYSPQFTSVRNTVFYDLEEAIQEADYEFEQEITARNKDIEKCPFDVAVLRVTPEEMEDRFNSMKMYQERMVYKRS